MSAADDATRSTLGDTARRNLRRIGGVLLVGGGASACVDLAIGTVRSSTLLVVGIALTAAFVLVRIGTGRPRLHAMQWFSVGLLTQTLLVCLSDPLRGPLFGRLSEALFVWQFAAAALLISPRWLMPTLFGFHGVLFAWSGWASDPELLTSQTHRLHLIVSAGLVAFCFARLRLLREQVRLTERVDDARSAQQAILGLSEERQRHTRELLGAIPSMVCLVDADGRCLLANGLWSVDGEAIRERVDCWWQALDDTNRELAAADWRAAVQEADEFHGLYRLPGEGSDVPLRLGEVIAHRLDEGDRYVVTLTDVSHRTQAEQELRSMRPLSSAAAADAVDDAVRLRQIVDELREALVRAEAASESKSEFLANMSHEIRTPLTSVIGYADVLRSELGSDIPQASSVAVSAADAIHRNGRHLLTLINDILDHSKLEAGKLAIERLPCSPASIATEVIDLFQEQVAEKRIGLEVVFRSPLPETIQSDPTRLRQVLINLVGNAVKFTPAGGVRLDITFRPDDTTNASDQAGGTVRFKIVDTGIGISESALSGLFDAFTQADASTTRIYGGTGLGLTITARLVHLLGGTIDVVSEPGRGSTFQVELPTGNAEPVALHTPGTTAPLPQSAEPQTTATPAPTATKPLEGLRVLLAEDGEDNQRLIQFLLRKAGAESELAVNGEEAVALVRAATEELPFDVVLMDMHMPKLDGLEATRTLRVEGYSLPIVALTANASDEARAECLAAGCDEHVGKPIDRARLFGVVRDLVDSPSVPCQS